MTASAQAGFDRKLIAPLMLLPMFLTAIVVSTSTGRRNAVQGKLVVGGIGLIAACALLFLLNSGSAIWLLVLVAMVVGIPQGLTASPTRMLCSTRQIRTGWDCPPGCCALSPISAR